MGSRGPFIDRRGVAHRGAFSEPRRFPPRFVVDHMLLRLGKYLRILGYDAQWDTGVRTHELIERANREGRIFVTRNRRLPYQYPPAAQAVSVAAREPVAQFREVTAALGIDVSPGMLFSRCIRCNVELASVDAVESLRGRVPGSVLAHYSRFYRCPACQTVFWKGTHVLNTCRKLGIAAPEER